jgi:hypothetical protein
VSAKTDQLARRKEELVLLARIERIEFTQNMRELRRLKRPLNFAVIGARLLGAWRNPAWVSAAATLLAARGLDSGRIMRALRYAGYAYAAWRTYRLFRDYVGDQSGRGTSRP